jgi:hypothetical protein
VARYVVNDAWPIKYDPGDLNAKGNDVLIETLELSVSGLTIAFRPSSAPPRPLPRGRGRERRQR